MTHVIVLVGHAGLPPPDIPPPLAVVLAAVERERRREQDLQAVADGAGEELGVDVEGDGRVAVFRVRGEPGDAVVFLRVDGREGEGVGEEVRVAHGGVLWARCAGGRGCGSWRVWKVSLTLSELFSADWTRRKALQSTLTVPCLVFKDII